MSTTRRSFLGRLLGAAAAVVGAAATGCALVKKDEPAEPELADALLGVYKDVDKAVPRKRCPICGTLEQRSGGFLFSCRYGYCAEGIYERGREDAKRKQPKDVEMTVDDNGGLVCSRCGHRSRPKEVFIIRDGLLCSQCADALWLARTSSLPEIRLRHEMMTKKLGFPASDIKFNGVNLGSGSVIVNSRLPGGAIAGNSTPIERGTT